MNIKNISQEVSVFHGRTAPEQGMFDEFLAEEFLEPFSLPEDNSEQEPFEKECHSVFHPPRPLSISVV